MTPLLWVDALTPGRVPAFEEVEAQARDQWIGLQREKARREAFAAMRDRYEINLPTTAEKGAEGDWSGSGCGAQMMRLRRSAWTFLSLSICLLTGGKVFVPEAEAHESRPVYLEIKETAMGSYELLWRTPLLAGMRLPVS